MRSKLSRIGSVSFIYATFSSLVLKTGISWRVMLLPPLTYIDYTFQYAPRGKFYTGQRHSCISRFLLCASAHQIFHFCRIRLFCRTAKSTVTDFFYLIIYRDSVFHEDSLHESCSCRNLYGFSFICIICDFGKNMSFVI